MPPKDLHLEEARLFEHHLKRSAAAAAAGAPQAERERRSSLGDGATPPRRHGQKQPESLPAMPHFLRKL